MVGHVLPGAKNPYYDSRLWLAQYEVAYLKLVSDYADIIVTQLFGHLHPDIFRLVPDAYASVKVPLFANPSLSPRASSVAPDSNQTDGKNPAVRMYELQDNVLANYYTYWTDLPAANTNGYAKWQLLYQPLEEYSLTDFSGDSMAQLAKDMVTNSTLWCKFFHNWFVAQDYWECDQSCRQMAVCSMLTQLGMRTLYAKTELIFLTLLVKR